MKNLYKYLLISTLFLNPTVNAYADTQNSSSWLDSYNRTVFEFNTKVDKYTLKPIAEGYRAITTPDIRNRVNSALYNVLEPVSAGNHALQGSFKKTMISIARFAINSTLGLAGMFDVAQGWGLEKDHTNFDETFATYCIPDGPMIMIPFYGPSTPRSMTGMIAAVYADPLYWAMINDKNYADKIGWSYAAVGVIAVRERSLDLLNDLEQNSVDYYAAVSSAYEQNRQKLKKLCIFRKEDNTQSYDFDFDIDEENEF